VSYEVSIAQFSSALKELEFKIDSIRNKKAFFLKLRLRSLEKKKIILKEQLFLVCADYLEKTNESYKKLVQENYLLLETDNIIFKVNDITAYPFDTYTKKLKGTIHRNGCAYIENTDSAWEFASGYEKRIKGKIDYWGNLNLMTVSTHQIIFGSRDPTELQGTVSKNGEIDLNTTKTEFNITAKNNSGIAKMIGNHFDSEVKLERFFENAEILKGMVNTYISEL
jgi:hypothetical protein